jgi:formate hydrogenlyase subunit 3/multisubunit Na+/H+ antiporter MnhD subunit
MNAPLGLFSLSLLVSLSAFALRGRPRGSSMAAAGGMAILAAIVLLLGFDHPYDVLGISIKFSSRWVILGRSFALSQEVRPMIGYLFLSGAFLLAPAWLVDAPRYFTAIAPLILATVAASIMVQPFLFSAVFIELAAMGAVLIIVSPGTKAANGGLRLLTLYTIAMIAILVAGWQLETGAVTSAAQDLARRMAVMLGLGFGILLAIPPFHLWLPSAIRESNPYVVAFIVVILQAAGLLFLFRFLDSYPWLRDSEDLLVALQWIGAVTLLLGSLWAAAQRDIRLLSVYALLADLGVMLIAMGAGTGEGFRLALVMSASRILSLGVLSLGLTYLARENAVDLRGAGYRWPLASATFLVGLLSLIGLPLTAGFPGRWSLLSGISDIPIIIAITVFGCMALLATVALRWAFLLFSPQMDMDVRPAPLEQRVFMLGGVGLTILLGVFPQAVFPWVVETVAGLTRLFQ